MAKPIVKWAGGKHRLIGELQKYLPETIDTYVEPFAGGAALFFALASDERGPRFKRAVLADRNEELVACYRAVKHDVAAVIDALGAYKYDRELYYQTRDLDTEAMSDVERAARLIFLNHTCFNGLWRVNASGKFNVPFGRYSNPRIVDAEGLREASRALAWAEILHVDFATAPRGHDVAEMESDDLFARAFEQLARGQVGADVDRGVVGDQHGRRQAVEQRAQVDEVGGGFGHAWEMGEEARRLVRAAPVADSP